MPAATPSPRAARRLAAGVLLLLAAAVAALASTGVGSHHDAGARLLATQEAEVRYQVAPGLTFTSWTDVGPRGPVRLYLLAADDRQPGLRLQYRNPGRVASVDTVLDMARAAGGLAAVNGDFYDIGRTGAPLGVGRSATTGLWNARTSGWNSAFYTTPTGRPEIGTVTLAASVAGHPDVTVTGLNSHLIPPDGLSIYTPRWGREPDAEVTSGVTSGLRRVVIEGGRVVATSRNLHPGRPIRGTVLIARGKAATALHRALPFGSRARVTWGLTPRARTVVTGSVFLVQDGVSRVVDDQTMAPRTAIGIDRDTHELLILVADGRRQDSRGYTMVELANQMIDLGADEALNLDGGGSSTMVTRKPGGSLGVRNHPSDGFQRRVGNSLVLTYRPQG